MEKKDILSQTYLLFITAEIAIHSIYGWTTTCSIHKLKVMEKQIVIFHLSNLLCSAQCTAIDCDFKNFAFIWSLLKLYMVGYICNVEEKD